MKRLFALVSLMASLLLAVAAPVGAQSSSDESSQESASETSALDLTAKVGDDTVGYITIPSDYVVFHEVEAHAATLLQWSREGFTVVSLDKMTPYPGVEQDPTFGKLPRSHVFAYDRYVALAATPGHQKISMATLNDYPSSYKDVIAIDAHFAGKTLRLIYFSPESDPDNVYYIAVEGLPGDIDALEAILKTWTPN